MQKIRSFFAKNWIRLLASFGVGLFIMALYNLILHFNNYSNVWTSLYYYANGATIAGFCLLFFGLLLLLSHFGAFDIFTFYIQRKKKENGSKENYGDYVNRKREENSTLDLYFLAYIIVGVLFIIFSIIAILILRSYN